MIEYGAGKNSLLGIIAEQSKNCEVMTITEEIDATSDSGHKLSLDTISNSKDPGFIWTSMPCTGG